MNIHKPLSKTVQEIEVAATKKIELIAKSKPGVISLAQGIPSFLTPDHIKKAAKKAMDLGLTDKYSKGYGIDELREEITKKLKRDNHMIADSSQIIVTHGGIEALMAIFLTLLDKDDEVIVLTPDYASHLTQLKIATGIDPVCVSLDETDNQWVVNEKKIEKAITKRTKAILFCNPTNPTGKVYSYDELESIANLALKHNLYIVSDEMYEYFVFDNKKHISIGSFEKVKDLVISVFGLSKSYAMTGWRIGYIVASNRLIEQIFKIHDSLVTCPTVVSQYGALAALQGSQKEVLEYKNTFIKRRQIVLDAFSKTDKLHLITPMGAYYAFPKFTKNSNDKKIALEIIDQAKVAVIPGSAFGTGGESHIRISFGGDEEKLREGLKRFVSYVNTRL